MPSVPNPPLDLTVADLSGTPAHVGETSTPFADPARLSRGTGHSNPFPPASWTERMSAYAAGTKSSLVFKGHHEKQVARIKRDFQQALSGAADQRAEALANVIQTHLAAPYTPNKETARALGSPVDPEKARVLKATMLAATLGQLVPEGGSKDNQKLLSQVLQALPAADQVSLMRGDAAAGKHLYSAAYLAAKTGTNEQKSTFAEVKAAAQMASVQRRLDELDTTGQAVQVLRQFSQHLQDNGVAAADQRHFVDKLSFKMVLQAKQGDYPDIPAPNVNAAGWQDDLTAALGRTLAESRASDAAVLQMLNTTPEQTAKFLAHAATGSKIDPRGLHQHRREGDFRMLRLVQEQAEQNSQQPGWQRLGVLAKGLEKGTFDRNLALTASRENKAPASMLAALEQEKNTYQQGLAQKINNRLEAIHAGVIKNIQNLEVNLQFLRQNEDLPPAKLKKWGDFVKEDNSRLGAKEVSGKMDVIQRGLESCEAFIQANPTALKVQPDEAAKLLERFGRHSLAPITADEAIGVSGAATGMQGHMDLSNQFSTQVESLRDANVLVNGLDKTAMVLPTAGRDLKDCAWVGSMARDLAQTAQEIRTAGKPNFNLTRHPIIIIDQTDGDGSEQARVDKFDSNAAYLRGLEQRYQDVGMKFEHVSMRQINAMTQGTETRKLFDTTGECNAGFGGGRNMAFLLGPVIQATVKEGRSLTDITPANLDAQISQHAMSGSCKVFMGDDTDCVSAGMVASVAGIAASAQHGDSYTLHSISRGGRDTQSVATLQSTTACKDLDQTGYDGAVATLFSVNKWEGSKMTSPGMGCTFGNPRFCLDLPTGKEETHHDAAKFTSNKFGTAFHLSGDRQNSPSEQLRNNMAYTNLTAALGKLWDNKNHLPWNIEAKDKQRQGTPFNNLGEVMAVAADPAKNEPLQRLFVDNLAKWRAAESPDDGIFGLSDPEIVNNIDRHLNSGVPIDAEARDELVKMRDVYQDGAAQVELIKKLVDDTFHNLAKDANNQGKNLPTNRPLTPAEVKVLDLTGFKDALDKARNKLGIELGQNKNRMVRDMSLIMESVGAGGFQRIAQNLQQAHQLRLQQPIQNGIGQVEVKAINHAPVELKNSQGSPPINASEEPLTSRKKVSADFHAADAESRKADFAEKLAMFEKKSKHTEPPLPKRPATNPVSKSIDHDSGKVTTNTPSHGASISGGP